MERRQRGVSPGLILLLYQISQVGLQNIPSVTLGVLALNIFLFLNPLRPLPEVCLSVSEAVHRRNWHRLLLAPFHHADDWHLYYNMISMLWKGIMLERKLKSIWFAYTIAVFSVLIGVVYMVLELLLVIILDDPSYEMNCGVGFSGVLFALKVLNNHYNPGRVSTVFGLPISSKYACWVELVAIHLISPGTSFAGHLAGILVGLMYTMGPLKKIMQACTAGVSFFTEPNRPRDYYSEYYGYYPDYQYRTPRSYFDYTGGLTEEEQLERAVLNSLNERDYVWSQAINFFENHWVDIMLSETAGVLCDPDHQYFFKQISEKINFGGGTHNNERRPYGFWFPPEHPEEEIRRQRLRRFDRR